MKKKLLLTTLTLFVSFSLSACGDNAEHEHNWEAPTYEWFANNTMCVAKRFCKNDITHMEMLYGNIESKRTVEPTCTTDGKDVYTAAFTESWATTQTVEQVVSKLDHIWGTTTYTWNEDYTSCVAKHVCLIDETHVETSNGTVTVEHKIPASCTESGLDIVTAKFPEIWAIDQVENVYVEAAGHEFDYDNVSYEWATDYSKCSAIVNCKNCRKYGKYSSLSTSHTTKKATCTEDGLDTYKATFTSSLTWAKTQIKEVVIPATGHDLDYYGTCDNCDRDFLFEATIGTPKEIFVPGLVGDRAVVKFNNGTVTKVHFTAIGNEFSIEYVCDDGGTEYIPDADDAYTLAADGEYYVTVNITNSLAFGLFLAMDATTL